MSYALPVGEQAFILTFLHVHFRGKEKIQVADFLPRILLFQKVFVKMELQE